LHAALQPDTLLERFAFRKTANLSKGNEFMAIKGIKGQIENDEFEETSELNPNIGFKSTKYSVTESSGSVEITIIKKINEEFTFTYRTADDTATDSKEYVAKEETVTMGSDEKEHKI
jgi:hypothetical protein